MHDWPDSSLKIKKTTLILVAYKSTASVPIAADSSEAELLQSKLTGSGGPGDIDVVMLGVE